MQGIENDAFRSPSRSLSGTALEKLRKQGAKSPPTVRKGDKPDNRADGTVADSQPVLGDALAAAKPTTRKRTEAPGVQSIHKWLKKNSGDKASAEGEAQQEEEKEEMQEEAVDAAAAVGSPSMSSDSLLGGGCPENAARQLNDIVAGFGSCNPTPVVQATGPEPTPGVPSSDPASSEKENQAKKGRAQKRGSSGTLAAANEKMEKTSTGRGKKSRQAIDTTDPTPPSAAAAAALAEDGGRRRIPTRLVPWNCGLCTFENKGSDAKCQMCQTIRGADTPPAVTAAAERAALATAAAVGQHIPMEDIISPDVGEGSGRTEKAGRKKGEAQQARPARKLTGGVKGTNNNKRKESGAAAAAAGGGVDVVAVKEGHNQAAAAVASPPGRATSNTANLWTGGKMASWTLLGSGLDTTGREQLRTLATVSGATVVDKWNPRVTHVICGAGGAGGAGERSARRTFKFLMGVLHGRWVLTQDWITTCLASKKSIEEGEFVVEKDGVGCPCGAATARAAAVAAVGGGAWPSPTRNGVAGLLLRGYEVQLQGEFANRGQMVDLLKAAGATVVSRLPTEGAAVAVAAAGKKRNSKASAGGGGVVLVEVPDSSEAAIAGYTTAIMSEGWYKKAMESGIPVASHRWVTDSISKFELCSVDAFLIGN